MSIYVVDRNCSTTDVSRFKAAIDRAIRKKHSVAFDCEGVNLSRAGSLEIASLCFENDDGLETFLVDMGSKFGIEGETLAQLKRLLESDQLRKIIHDARMDADALFHLHGIRLTHTHDTNAFHQVLANREDIGLNDLLTFYGLEPNTKRNNQIYKINPRFWAQRPLTQSMKERAAADIDKLHVVANRQLDTISQRGDALLTRAYELSDNLSQKVRAMQLERRVRCEIPRGRFIGRGGSNIRSVQRHTDTVIYDDGEQGGRFMIFYPNAEALSSARRAMSTSSHAYEYDYDYYY